jgi:hypothetical protein
LPSEGKEKEGTKTTPPHEVENLIDFSSLEVDESFNPPQFPDLFGLVHDTATATPYIATWRDNTQPTSNPFSDQYQSYESSGPDTPRTLTPPTLNSQCNSQPYTPTTNTISFEEDVAATRKRQSEWAQDDYNQELLQVDTTLTRQFELKFPPVDSSSISQFEIDYPPVDISLSIDFLTAQNLQAEYDTELQVQESYARQVQHSEKQQWPNFDQDLAEARRLQSEWEAQDASAQQDWKYWQAKSQQENQQMAAQVEFARGVVRWDEEMAEQIERDKAAALAAQAQWEAATMELEAQVKRAVEEAERREAEDRRREAEEEAARRAEEERRDAEDRRRQAEEEAALRAEQERRARVAECVSCTEEGEKKDMCMLSCEHGYCRGCVAGSYLPVHFHVRMLTASITEAIKSALKSRAPFKCCNATPPIPLLSRFLPAPLLASYNNLLLELSTPNPKYCSNAHCSLFLPPSSITGPLAICSSCRTRTCALCSAAEHAGVCQQDVAGQKVLALAGRKGWKICPNCKSVLERTEGCLHMTCRCGAQWCYSCLANWGSCQSTCPRR